MHKIITLGDVDLKLEVATSSGGGVIDVITTLDDGLEKKESIVSVVLPGRYDFKAKKSVRIIVLNGELRICFRGATDFATWKVGHELEIEKGLSYTVNIEKPVVYHCEFAE